MWHLTAHRVAFSNPGLRHVPHNGGWCMQRRNWSAKRSPEKRHLLPFWTTIGHPKSKSDSKVNLSCGYPPP